MPFSLGLPFRFAKTTLRNWWLTVDTTTGVACSSSELKLFYNEPVVASAWLSTEALMSH